MEKYLAQISLNQSIIIGVVILLLYYVSVFDDGGRYESQIAQGKQEIVGIEGEINRIRGAVREARVFEQQFKQLGDKFNQLIQYLPKDYKANDQMKMLSNEAQTAGLSIVRINSSGQAGEKFEFYEELLVNASLQGTYNQLLTFLSNLTKTNRVVTLKKITLRADNSAALIDEAIPQAPVLTMTADFGSYKYTGTDEVAPQ